MVLLIAADIEPELISQQTIETSAKRKAEGEYSDSIPGGLVCDGAFSLMFRMTSSMSIDIEFIWYAC